MRADKRKKQKNHKRKISLVRTKTTTKKKTIKGVNV